MASQVEVQELLNSTSALLDRIRRGEEVTLVEDGRPLAHVIPSATKSVTRGLGMLKDKIWIADDFHSPLPEEEMSEWEK